MDSKHFTALLVHTINRLHHANNRIEHFIHVPCTLEVVTELCESSLSDNLLFHEQFLSKMISCMVNNSELLVGFVGMNVLGGEESDHLMKFTMAGMNLL